MIRIYATKKDERSTQEIDYTIDSDSIHDILDEVRKLFKAGFSAVRIYKRRREYDIRYF